MKVANALLVLALVGTFALPPYAAGQSPEDCVTCANGRFNECIHEDWNPQGWAHWALDMENRGQVHIRKDGTHGGWYCYSCSVKHPPTCQDGGNPNPPPLYEEDDIEEIQEAVAEGDVLRALRITLREPEGSPIRLNRERMAIQVRGLCDETLVAVHIPLGHLPSGALATVLAEIDGSRLRRHLSPRAR